MTSRYEFDVRDDLDCLVVATCNENPALRLIGETQGYDAVMQTLLTAGCMYMRSREGAQIDDNTPVHEVAKAARLLGMHLAVNPAGEIVVVPVRTPGCRPIAIVERDGVPA